MEEELHQQVSTYLSDILDFVLYTSKGQTGEEGEHTFTAEDQEAGRRDS